MWKMDATVKEESQHYQRWWTGRARYFKMSSFWNYDRTRGALITPLCSAGAHCVTLRSIAEPQNLTAYLKALLFWVIDVHLGHGIMISKHSCPLEENDGMTFHSRASKLQPSLSTTRLFMQIGADPRFTLIGKTYSEQSYSAYLPSLVLFSAKTRNNSGRGAKDCLLMNTNYHQSKPTELAVMIFKELYWLT